MCINNTDTPQHNHGEYSSQALKKQVLNTACKRKAIENVSTRPKKIILTEIAQNSNSSDITINDINRIRKNIYENRRKIMPLNPTNIADAHNVFNLIDVKTKQSEHFLLVNDEKENIIIFSCETNLRFLSIVDNIYMDGIFDYSAHFFLQFYSILGYLNGYYVPLVFCLLPNKCKQTYIYVFRTISKKCKDLGLNFSPANITVDFERVIINAVSEMWTQTNISGCQFHLTQSWYRKIQEIGLSSVYKDESSEIGKWLRNIFGLLFLNPEDVSDCFTDDFMSECPIDERLQKFSDYFVETYISEDCIYPPKLWALASSELTRTTNACESFHSHFKNSFYRHSPSILQWLNVLIDEVQTDVYCKLRSVSEQKTPRNQILRRQIKNQNLIDKY
ncbi:hypothetical protein AGLY_004905 [Aphis glycines]|uniref:MULE transposase domain-containing protein n=1 Tax=Aphis glycines TaxID=307491 RepID=A0A6G0TXM2_APHGL|nr:hypothetical protein AGLY_004905 [Aphis glycines]